MKKLGKRERYRKSKLRKWLKETQNGNKQIDAKIYTQKLEKEYEEKREWTFEPKINQVSQVLSAKSKYVEFVDNLLNLMI